MTKVDRKDGCPRCGAVPTWWEEAARQRRLTHEIERARRRQQRHTEALARAQAAADAGLSRYCRRIRGWFDRDL